MVAKAHVAYRTIKVISIALVLAMVPIIGVVAQSSPGGPSVTPGNVGKANEPTGFGYRLMKGGALPSGGVVVEEYGRFRWVVTPQQVPAQPLLSQARSAYPTLQFRGESIPAAPVSDAIRSRLAGRPAVKNAYLIQFSGPFKTDVWSKKLKKTGVRLVNYVPSDGFLVWANGRQLLQALGLKTSTGYPMVHAVVSVEWDKRIEPALRDLANGRPPAGAPAAWVNGQPIAVHAWAFSDGALADVLAQIKAVDPGAQVVHDAGDTYVTASLSLADIVVLAKQTPGLKYVEIVRPKVLHNDLVSLPQVCDVETEWTSGWTGAGVIVDHNDSGVDTTHPDFPASSIQATSGPMATASSDNTHGTHTAGSVLGRGLAASTPTNTSGCGDQYAPESTVRGMAWGAKLATNNIFDSGGIGGDTSMMQWGVQQGAQVSTNSWGYGTQSSPDTTYDSHAIAVDTAVRDADSGTAGNQQLAIFFSAGNSGSSASTVGSPGLGKDVVTVGASQNARCGSYVPSYQSGPDIDTVAAFSSRGPSQGRIKPDICTPGTDVLSVQSGRPRAKGSGGTRVGRAIIMRWTREPAWPVP